MKTRQPSKEKARSMPRQMSLIDPPPRKRPRVLAHHIDAGHGIDGKPSVHYLCSKCGWHAWVPVAGIKRTHPCPQCNKQNLIEKGQTDEAL